MRKWMMAALLASAVVAAPAFAQDQGHDGHGQQGGGDHGGHGGDHGGDHQGGGAPHGGGAPQGGGQMQHVQQPPQQFHPAPQQSGGFAQQPRSGGAFGRPYRPDFQSQPNGGQPNGGDRDHAAFQHPQGGNPQFNGGQPDGGRHYAPRQDNGVNVWQGQGRPGGDPRFDGRGPGNGGLDHGRPNYVGRGDGGPGGWNRGWRQDRRYDWQGWRAQHGDIYRAGRYQPPYGFGYGYRRYGPGYRLPPVFFAEQYWIDNPDYYRLPPIYGDYRWVRYYNDALLIDLDDGEVVDSIPDFFYY